MNKPFVSAALAFAAGSLLAQTAPSTDVDGDEIYRLDAVTVSAATRTEKLASSLPVTTSVVTPEVLDRQLAISSDLNQVLAVSVPGFSPSRQKLTSYGESFRGRNPLYLVDGVPQSNPLRAGSRESLTIDPFFLGKIEAVHGSSAAQGMGATGGLINFVTRSAPASDGVTSLLEAIGVTSTRFKSDGYGGKVAALTAVRRGAASVVAGGTWERRPFAYDGEGRPLGVDNTQGDTLDSDVYGLFFKGGYDFNSRHSVELMINHFDLAQNLRWVAVAGNRAVGLPTSSVRGTSMGAPAENQVTTATLTFTDRDLFGGELSLNLFHQDFNAIYGGSNTASTLALFRLNGVPTFDQSQVEASKHGLRTTWVRTFPEAGNLGVVTGFDYLSDETAQTLVFTKREWVPYTTYEGWSPYAQFEKPFGPLTLSGGLRYEIAQLQVDDFHTLESYGGVLVRGGNPKFEEALFNLGATWQLNRAAMLYGSYAQGYGMADIGRILRAIGTPGLDVDDFINLDPVVTDNWELGVRFHGHGWRLGWNAFLSTAELGARLVANASGVYDVVREKSATYGTELNGEIRLPARLGTFGGYVAVLEGKSDRDGNGQLDRRLPALNITASKVALYWDKPWTRRFDTRLQSLTFLPRSDPDGVSAGDFSGYTLVDLLANYRVTDRQIVSVGVENLLDRNYITYFSATFTGSAATNANYYAGRGRSLSVRYRFEF
ncbi:MAG TPA: TonB-dependent receptor [Opitutus sp.]|nr:TonB-dependent receptor [Opitutus sp.]